MPPSPGHPQGVALLYTRAWGHVVYSRATPCGWPGWVARVGGQGREWWRWWLAWGVAGGGVWRVVSWGWVSWGWRVVACGVGGGGGVGVGMVAVVAGLGGGWWWRVACGVLGVGGLCGRGGVLCGRGGVLWWCPVWVATGWEWSAVRVACCVG